MSDDDEPGSCPATHFIEQTAEAIDIRIVQRSVDFVEDADRRWPREKNGKDQGCRRQGLFAPRHQSQGSKPLSGGAGVDLEACVQRVLTIRQTKFGFAAFEQCGEQRSEMVIDRPERFQKTRSSLGVQFMDAFTKSCDRS